jgi:acid phosphatase (class A)
MKKTALLLHSILLIGSQLLAQEQIQKPALSPSKHYASLSLLSKKGTNSQLDSVKFPLKEFMRLPYLKLRASYLTDLPSSFTISPPPANSSEQTKSEITFLLKLQQTRTSADTLRYLMLADVTMILLVSIRLIPTMIEISVVYSM